MAQVFNPYGSNASVASSSSSISENIAQYRNAWRKGNPQAVKDIATELATQFKQKGYKPADVFLNPEAILENTQKHPDKMDNWLRSVEAQESQQFGSNDSEATESISDQTDNQSQSTSKSFKQSVAELSNVLQASKKQVVPADVLKQSLNDVVNSVDPEEKAIAAEKANRIYNAAVIEKNDSKVAALGRSLLNLDPENMREGPEVADLPPIAPLGILASEALDRQSFVPNRISSSQSVGIPTRNNNKISSNSSAITTPYRLNNNLPVTRSVNLNNNRPAKRALASVVTSTESIAPSIVLRNNQLQNQLTNVFDDDTSSTISNSRPISSNHSVLTRTDRSIANESQRNRTNLVLNQLNDLDDDTKSTLSKASRYLNNEEDDDTRSVATRHTNTSWKTKDSRSSTATLQLTKARQEMEQKTEAAVLAAKAFEKSQQEVEELKRQLTWAEQELARKDDWIQKLDGNVEDLKFDSKEQEAKYKQALHQQQQYEQQLKDELDNVFAALEEEKMNAYAQSNVINQQTEYKDKLVKMLNERNIEAEQLKDSLQTSIDELRVSKTNYSALAEEVKRMEAHHKNTLDMIDKEVEQKYITKEEANLDKAKAAEQLEQYKLNLTALTTQYNKLKAEVNANKDQKSTELDLLKEQVQNLEAEQTRIVTAYRTQLTQELEKQKERIDFAWEWEKKNLSATIDRLTREKNSAVSEKNDLATKSEKLQKQLNEKLKEERKLRETSDSKLASLELEMVDLANKEKKALLKIASLEKRQPHKPPEDRDAEIKDLEDEIKDHQSKYDSLENLYKKEQELVATHTAEETRLYNTIQELQEKLQEFEEANVTVQGYKNLQRKTEHNQVDIATLQRKLKESKEDAFEKDQQITQLQDALAEAKKSKPVRSVNFIDYKSQLEAKTKELEDLHRKYLALLRSPASKRVKQPVVAADDSKQLLEEAQTKIDQLRTQVATLEGDLVIASSTLKLRDSTILLLNASINADESQAQFDQAVKVYKDQLKAKDLQIQELANEIREKDIALATAGGDDGGDEKKYNNNNNNGMDIDSSGHQPNAIFATYQPSLVTFTNASNWSELVNDFIQLQQQYSLLQGQKNSLQQQIDMLQRIHSSNPDLAQLQQDLKEANDDKERWKKASVETSEKNKRLKDQLRTATSGSQPPLPPNNNNNMNQSYQDLLVMYNDLTDRYNAYLNNHTRLIDEINRLETQLKKQKSKPLSFNITTGQSNSHAVERFLAVVASVY